MSTLTTINDLKQTVTAIDSLSQQGFSDIRSIARLALTALESPDRSSLDDIARGLRIIWGITDDIENLINCEAENVGCDWMSEPVKRRLAVIQEAVQ